MLKEGDRSMKKVGIMTWFRYQNYGTALQATALANVIRNMGYEPVEIDYKPRGINDVSQIGISTILKKVNIPAFESHPVSS